MSAFKTAGNSLIMLFVMGWGLLIGLSLIISFLRAAFSCVERLYNGDTRRISEEEDSGECYRTMSTERKEEIDNLRKNALLRYMSKFTLTLSDEDLLCCTGSGSSQTDTTLAIDENCVDTQDDDIEKGSKCVINNMVQDTNPIEAEAVEYTHISLPLPGYDIAGVNMNSRNNLEEIEDRLKVNRWKIASLLRIGDGDKHATEIQTEPVSATSTTDTNNHQQQEVQIEKRRVPIFCAICLTEYEKYERVCWSSNAECSHVFHEDCILQWLMTSGRKRSMNQFFDKHPTDEKLLKNEFCPCCRQDFISVKPEVLRGSEESA